MSIAFIALFSLLANIFLGKYRVRYPKMTLMWWIMIHASIPAIVLLRIWLNTPSIAIPLFIATAIAGQIIGSRFPA